VEVTGHIILIELCGNNSWRISMVTQIWRESFLGI